jgi:hypothetical protein
VGHRQVLATVPAVRRGTTSSSSGALRRAR